MHMENRILDSSAVVLAAAGGLFASAAAVNTYLQMIVLILTIVFIGLGIALRAMKIRQGGEDDEEEE